MDAGLKNKTILLTGASGGMGQCIAKALGSEKARLVLVDCKDEDEAEPLVNSVEGEWIYIQADLRQEPEVKRVFDRAQERFGRIESLVAAAGVYPSESVSVGDMTCRRWNETLLSDLTSVFLCCGAFFRNLERFKGDTGSIVLIGSTAVQFGDAGHADYAAAKAGLAYGLTLSLKNEITHLARFGRVNCICPGWTVTPMSEYLTKDSRLVNRVFATASLEKLGRPEDIAASVLYLVSDKFSGHVTGQIIVVSGGMEGRVLHGDISVKAK
jgi:3-oxoacyl-[acyl-carrier protein] reductase